MFRHGTPLFLYVKPPDSLVVQFDYVGYTRYYGVPKYNELDDNYDYNKNKDDDFDLSL